MQSRLEHANVAVRDFDGAIRCLRTPFPDFVVRRNDWEFVEYRSTDPALRNDMALDGVEGVEETRDAR